MELKAELATAYESLDKNWVTHWQIIASRKQLAAEVARRETTESRLATLYEECVKAVESTAIKKCEYMAAPGLMFDDAEKTLKDAAENVRCLASGTPAPPFDLDRLWAYLWESAPDPCAGPVLDLTVSTKLKQRFGAMLRGERP